MSSKPKSSRSSFYIPDIPLEDTSQKEVFTDKNDKLQEAVPFLTGAETSTHRIDLLPIWHPKRNLLKWLVLAVSCLFSVGSYFAYDSIGVVEQAIEEKFGISSSQFGLLYTVYSLPNIILPFVGGIVLDRIGLPLGTTSTTFLVMLGSLMVALAPQFGHSFYLMLAGRFLFGVGAETSYVAQNTICCVWFKHGKILSFAMGITLSAGRLGSFFTFAANSMIVDHFGDYTAALWAGAIFSLMCFVAGLIYMILHHAAMWMVRGTLAELDTKNQDNAPFSFRSLVGYPAAFYIASIICCVYYGAVFPFQSTAVSMLQRTKDMDETIAGYYVSIIPATSLFLSPVFGIIVDKVGRKIYFIVVGLAVMVPAFVLIAAPWWPPVISFILIGLCFSAVPAAIWPCIPLLVEERQIGAAFGLMSSFVNAGMSLMYWLQGEFLSDDGTTETYLYSGMLGAGFLLSCVWLMLDARMNYRCNGPATKLHM